MTEIHPSSQIASTACLGAGVRIGPFCVIGPDVVLGEECELVSHVVIAGRTTIGPRLRAYPFASLGYAPQDLKYTGEPSQLRIGSDCIIREGVTINPGTLSGGMMTVIGDHCTLLAQAHVGHDCRLGDHIVLSNNVLLAGHVRVGDWACVGGGSAVIQFARIGAHAFLGGLSGLEGDLIPYGLAYGARARLKGLNMIGLRRRAIPRASIQALRMVYQTLFASEALFQDRVNQIKISFGEDPCVAQLISFLDERKSRPLCQPEKS